jgi:hypothetical protein
MASITSASAIYALSIASLFPTPQQLQQFAADDIYDTDDVESVQVLMGVDGHLSGGFVFKEVTQNISLQADSPSNDLFDAWYSAQPTARDVFIANGSVTLISIGRMFTMTRGFLTRYKPMPDGKKVLQPRRYQITWGTVSAAPI